MTTNKLVFLLATAIPYLLAVSAENGQVVQFIAAVSMKHILPKAYGEGRKLFELELPERLRQKYIQELAEAAAVMHDHISIYGIYSDGDFLYVPTKVVFPSEEDADSFRARIEQRSIVLSNEIAVIDGPLTANAEIEQASSLAVSEDGRVVSLLAANESPPDAAHGLQPWQIGIISAAAAAILSVAIIAGVLFHRRRHVSKSGESSVNEDSLFGDHAEPVNVQCIDSATSSRAPAQENDIQPPAPPSAPPAGMVMN